MLATRSSILRVTSFSSCEGVAPGSPLHAGQFIGGSLLLATAPALALPQTAVVDRDGLYYAFRVSPENRVNKVKVRVGRREGEAIEIVEGLRAGDRVVASGGAFLSEGDLVRVVP